MSIALRERALEIAVQEIGVHEIGGNNRGPRVEEYLASVGLPPGQPWCGAFVYFCYQQAARELRVINPLPKTGKVTRSFCLVSAQKLWLSDRPSLGAIYYHSDDQEDPDALGHMGIVLSPGDAAIFHDISGNTNEAGSREGNCVRSQPRRRSFANLGFIDIGREGPLPA